MDSVPGFSPFIYKVFFIFLFMPYPKQITEWKDFGKCQPSVFDWRIASRLRYDSLNNDP